MKPYPYISLEKRIRAKFINSLSGFKSANLIGTVSNKGQTNLSIISSAFHLGADPALMGFIIRPDTAERHTLNNLRQNQLCTLNHVHKDFFKNAHQTSARYPQEVSEFQECGFTEEYLNNFQSPFVKESDIKMSLELKEEKKLEINGTHFMVCKILDIYVPETLINEDGHIDLFQAGTVCVSGLDSYHEVKKGERLPYARP